MEITPKTKGLIYCTKGYVYPGDLCSGRRVKDMEISLEEPLYVIGSILSSGAIHAIRCIIALNSICAEGCIVVDRGNLQAILGSIYADGDIEAPSHNVIAGRDIRAISKNGVGANIMCYHLSAVGDVVVNGLVKADSMKIGGRVEWNKIKS